MARASAEVAPWAADSGGATAAIVRTISARARLSVPARRAVGSHQRPQPCLTSHRPRSHRPAQDRFAVPELRGRIAPRPTRWPGPALPTRLFREEPALVRRRTQRGAHRHRARLRVRRRYRRLCPERGHASTTTSLCRASSHRRIVRLTAPAPALVAPMRPATSSRRCWAGPTGNSRCGQRPGPTPLAWPACWPRRRAG